MGDFQDSYRIFAPEYDKQIKKPPLGDERELWVQVHAPAGWGRRIRTFGMTESESVALPLGDTPIFD